MVVPPGRYSVKSLSPLTPKEAMEAKLQTFPREVIQSFNELIVEKIGANGVASFTQEEVIDRIMSKTGSIPRNVIFEKHYLDVESYFRKAGWKVTFEKSDYNSSEQSRFTFEDDTAESTELF